MDKNMRELNVHILGNKQIKSILYYYTYIPVSYLEIADLK